MLNWCSLTRNLLRGSLDLRKGTGALETLIISSNYLSCDVGDFAGTESELGGGDPLVAKNSVCIRILKSSMW